MTRKEITKLFVRFLITFACMLVVLIPIGILLEKKVSDFVMIVIFVTIAGGALAIEEYVHFKLLKRRERLKEQALLEEEMEAKSKKKAKGEQSKQKSTKDDKRGKVDGK